MSGTSAAAPMVTGIVALMLGKDDSLTPTQVRDALQESALDLNTSEWDIYTGYGRVRADEAFSAINNLTVRADSHIHITEGDVEWDISSHMRIENGDNAGLDYVKVEYRIGDSGTWCTIREEETDLNGHQLNCIYDNDFISVGPSTKIWVRWTVGYHPDTRSEYVITYPFWPK